MFAIEVNGWMAQQQVEAKDQTGNRVVPVVECIRSIVEVLRGQLLTKTIDKVGILLFGLQLPDLASLPLFEGVSAEANCNCLMLHDLESPKLAALKTLTSLLENEDERSKILVPSDETIAMSSILFYLNQVFTTKASNFKSRNLIIVTDNDNPHQSNPSSRAAAAIRAKDLYDLGVNTELIPFSKPNHKFDWTLFYDVRASSLQNCQF